MQWNRRRSESDPHRRPLRRGSGNWRHEGSRGLRRDHWQCERARSQTTVIAGLTSACLPSLYDHRDNGRRGDAALLELSTPTTAPAIPLATSANAERLRAGTHALIAGWGEIEYGQKQLTGELMWARSTVRGGHCIGSHFNMKARICVTHPPGVASGSCFGDSGGPLLAAGPRGQGLVEIGLAHAVFGNCSTKFPDIYTRADLISPWVDRWIAALDPPTFDAATKGTFGPSAG